MPTHLEDVVAAIRRIDQNQRRSRAVVHDGLVFLAGQTADDLTGDIRHQARGAFDKVDALLAEAGSGKTAVLGVTIWLRDMADYDGFNEVWDTWIVRGESPTRACAAVAMHDPRVRVELIVTAALAG